MYVAAWTRTEEDLIKDVEQALKKNKQTKNASI